MNRPLLLPLVTALALAGCGGHPDGDRPVRQLTPTEYNNAVRDLFGFAPGATWPAPPGEDWAEYYEEDEVPHVWPWVFPAEVGVDGFEGFAEGQVASPWGVEQAEAAAAHFARWAPVAPAFWTCDRAAADGDALPDCAWESVQRFAHRAWRRPATEDELARLRAFHDANVAALEVDQGVVQTVRGLLQTPGFLYLVEEIPAETAAGNVHRLTQWELASRLSFFLWDSMPDPTLFAAASRGELATREQIATQARRMLDDPRAREAVVRFHDQWLEVDAVTGNRADMGLYGERWAGDVLAQASTEEDALQDREELWSGILIGMRASMIREAQLFVEDRVFGSPGTLSDMLTSTEGWATTIAIEEDPIFDTAALYGATPTGAESRRENTHDDNLPLELELRRVTLPADQRAGILTLGATLAGRAHPVHPAPVLRGVFMLERLACEEIGQPPESAAGTAPPDAIGADSTNRERVAAVTSPAECTGCHERINPLGFAFENFDSVGGWRDTDNGSAVDASGDLIIRGEDTQAFDGPVQLAAHLASSDSVHDCYARTWVRYALGRTETPGETEALRTIQDRFRRNGGDIRDLLVAIATSNLFRTRPTAGGSQ